MRDRSVIDFKPMSAIQSGRTRALSLGGVESIAPAVAERVARLVGLYAAIDVAVMEFTVACLSKDVLQNADIMVDLAKNPNIRRNMAKVLAESFFRERGGDLAISRQVLGDAKNVLRVRDKLVHDYWAFPPNHANKLVLIDSRDMVNHFAGIRHMEETVDPDVAPSPGGRRLAYLPDDDFPEERLNLRGEVVDVESADKQITYFQDTLKNLRLLARLAHPDPEKAQRARDQLST